MLKLKNTLEQNKKVTESLTIRMVSAVPFKITENTLKHLAINLTAIWSVLEKVPCTSKKCVYSVSVG